MAYDRYTYANNRYSVSLYREGASSTAPARRIKLWGESPLVVERDARRSMDARWGTRTELHLVSETHYAYEHIVLDEREWWMEVKTGTTLIFKGRVERGLYEEQYDSIPYECTLTASCGIKRLDDYRLDIDALPRTERQVTPLWEVIKGCLRLTGQSEVEAAGDVAPWLTAAHINAEIYRTDEDGLISSETAGEVLDGILSSLGLVCYHTGAKWRIERVSHLATSTPVVLETSEHYLEGTPSLETEAAMGSIRINLPEERSQNVYRLKPATLPLPTCPYSEDYFSESMPPLFTLSASKGIAQRATRPSVREQARGMQVRIPYVAKEAVALSIPYNPPREATGIKIDIELGFEGLEGWDGDLLAVAEIKAGNSMEPEFMSARGGVCYAATDNKDPKQFRRLPQTATEVRDNSLIGQRLFCLGMGKEGANTFRSVWSVTPKDKMQYQAYYKTSINDYIRNHLPYAKVSRSELEGGKMAKFGFVSDLVYPQTIEIHEQRKRDRGISYKVDLTTLAVYIPLRFYAVRDGLEATEITPSTVMVGRIYITYEYAHEGEYDRFVVADMGKAYLRKGEPIDLTYTTRITGVALPPSLKGQLTDKDGKPLEDIGGRTIPEWVAASYFATMAKPHDTLSLTTATPTPYPVGTLFRLRNRPHHTYRLMGSRYDARLGTSELTLSDAPSPLDATRYDL